MSDEPTANTAKKRIDFYQKPSISSIIPPSDQTISTVAGNGNDNSNLTLSKVVGTNYLVDGISIRINNKLTEFFHDIRTYWIQTIDQQLVKPISERSRVYYNYENQITSNISKLHTDKLENLLPGFGYIAVAFMTGSIITKRRSNVVIKFALPLVLSGIAFKYALPSTFNNTIDSLYNNVEKKIVSDEFLRKQTLYWNNLTQLNSRLKEKLNKATIFINGNYHSAVTLIKDWTGLNV
ncbi:uncharacterized protein SCODWIG_03286 [Saccharomycodes ludwigii]|uniref:MICOS complex subunit n=1 Tax=Saccharomycodes ludwigii TaxID=36035 RepID=A0A376BA16_9ASCO|nr:hypothetical protein SCDLUD_004544 [Saccharomycodes ludwigii]KAH3899118.1 hypothetical protein SCDLUD_004544 [Saccharomycodes ludwigii]SSD61525.1 uncharacterized protein SCODWIG_03286 [Saccharomycodes ludwigii]